MSLTYNFLKLSNKYASSLATITILLLTFAVLATLLLTAPSKDAEIKARFPLTSDGFRSAYGYPARRKVMYSQCT